MVVVLIHLSIHVPFNQQTYTKHLCANSGNTNRRKTNLYPLCGDRWENQLSTLRIISPTKRRRDENEEMESCVGTKEGGRVDSSWDSKKKLHARSNPPKKGRKKM